MINWKLGETSCVKVKERERRKHEGEGVRNARCQEFSSLTVRVRVPRARVNYSIKITSLGHAIYRGQPTINLPSPTTHGRESANTRTHTHTTLPSKTLKNMSLHKICTNKNCRCRKCNWKKGQPHKLAAITTIPAEKPVGTLLISQQTKSLLSLYLKQCLCPVL